MKLATFLNYQNSMVVRWEGFQKYYNRKGGAELMLFFDIIYAWVYLYVNWASIAFITSEGQWVI